jgi:hypothetical protein
MSALPPKADIRPRDQDVCFGPIADVNYVTITRSAKEKNMSSIKYDRLYSGSDGTSRVQKNLEIEVMARDFVPPAPPIGVSEFNPASKPSADFSMAADHRNLWDIEAPLGCPAK